MDSDRNGDFFFNKTPLLHNNLGQIGLEKVPTDIAAVPYHVGAIINPMRIETIHGGDSSHLMPRHRTHPNRNNLSIVLQQRTKTPSAFSMQPKHAKQKHVIKYTKKRRAPNMCRSLFIQLNGMQMRMQHSSNCSSRIHYHRGLRMVGVAAI